MRIPASPPSLDKITADIESERLIELITGSYVEATGKYLHWDELRRRPRPKDMSHKEWWLKVKLGRNMMSRELPLKDLKGIPFQYCLTDTVLERLPVIDAQAKGSIGVSEQIINSEHRNRYVVSSLIEEAITSSQLEGAVTTRKDAVAMIRSGRSPSDKSERMIMNNYFAMQEILVYRDDEITPEKICEIHRVITNDTLERPEMAGQIQREEDERVKVWDDSTGESLHTPPPASELPARMQLMCDFANQTQAEGRYIHPIVRAITLHFWLAYDHPFEDGNGRTARAIFYWLMLKQGYWLFEFVSISSLIKKGWAAYARSFLYTETDDNDLTYFINSQLKIMLRAITSLEHYMERKSQEINTVEQYLLNIGSINHRQKALIGHALKHPSTVYTIDSHGRSQGVAYATSRADLIKLSERGLLRSYKQGKSYRYVAVEGLAGRLREIVD